MSNLENFNQKLESLQAIQESDTRSPSNVPVDVFLQEAENLHFWCQKDRETLIENGLDESLIDDIPIRCGALREAQSRWTAYRFTHESAEKEWVEKSPLAYNFKTELLHTMRFAYRRRPDLLSRVAVIAEGYGHADMIQDLNDIAVLGKENPEPLEAINFDMTQLDRAAQMADEMATLLSATITERADTSQAIKLRNQAFTHLKEAVDEVRHFGQYIFWRNEARFRGYRSEHIRKFTSRKSNSEQEEAVISE